MTIPDEAVQATRIEELLCKESHCRTEFLMARNARSLAQVECSRTLDNLQNAKRELYEAGFTGNIMRDANGSHVRAITDALPFLQGVKVKALEWRKTTHVTTDDDGGPMEGVPRKLNAWVSEHYKIIQQPGIHGLFILRGKSDGVGLVVGTIEAAKSAAQADYEARILSAVETVIPVSAPSPRAQALEELPCDVQLPGVILKRGVKFSVLLAALKRRDSWPENDRALSSQPVADGWEPIETAPKDGTIIDLWSSEFGRQPDCFWGKRSHCCGEDGQYCDSDWHSEPEAWIDSAQNTQTFDDITHWRPLPASPGASE